VDLWRITQRPMPASRASGFTIYDCRFTIETEVFAYFVVDVLSPLPVFAMLRRGKPELVPLRLHSRAKQKAKRQLRPTGCVGSAISRLRDCNFIDSSQPGCCAWDRRGPRHLIGTSHLTVTEAALWCSRYTESHQGSHIFL
jgi:hypothetical protein